jgi:MarR family multiple antibiotic resistance transcriptional regulator
VPERPPEPSPIVTKLRELIALNRLLERHLASELDLNATDLHAMEHLSRHGSSTPTELAQQLGVTSSAATFIIDRLAALGHVSRGPHPDDRRKTVVAPARESVQQVAGLIRPLAVGLAEHIDSMTPAERAAVESFLDAVAALYADAAERGLPGT